MTSVRSHAQDVFLSVKDSVETPPGHSDPCTEDRDDREHESPSQPLVNVSQDMRLVVPGAEPQACPALSLSKLSAGVLSSQEYSQAPAGGAQVACSQQPSSEFLKSLGIKVRDFAYENTLPAIVPVPRVPRQVQPAPRSLKRLQRDWDGKERPLKGLSLAHPCSGQTQSKKARSLERQPTEPLHEPADQHARALERITVRRMCSIISPSPRGTLPTTPLTGPSASPPTSPSTPPLSRLASQASDFVQTSPTFPFVVHVDNTRMIPASQLDPESQLHPVLYTRITLEPRSPPGCSPAPSPPQNASPAPLVPPFLELPFSMKGPGADPRARRCRGRGAVSTTSPNRYQLRQRPIPSSRASTLSRCAQQAGSVPKSLPRRTRRPR